MNRISLCFLLLACLVSCKSKDDQRLNSFIVNELKNNTDTLHFNRFKEIQWDKMYFIPPYTTFKNYDRTLFKYQNFIDPYNISARDDISLIMLFNGNHLVYTTAIKRNFDFDNAVKYNPYTKDEANFIVKKEDIIVTVQRGKEFVYKKQGYSYTFNPIRH